MSVIKRILGHSKFFTLIALISVALGITIHFIKGEAIWGININLIAVGLIFYLMGVTMILPHYKHKTFFLKFIIFLEFLLSQYIATAYFLLPAIGKASVIQFGNLNEWLALVLLTHATIHLFVLYIDKLSKHYLVFGLYIALMALGGYAYSQTQIDMSRRDLMSYGFYIHAILATYYVFKKSKKEKDEKIIDRKAKDRKDD